METESWRRENIEEIMADTNEKTSEAIESVEIDAAPSVEYMNLDNINIGSECEVKTELIPGSGKSDIVTILETDENAEHCSETFTVQKELGNNLENGLGSLNLKEKIEQETHENIQPEVHEADDDLKDCLLNQDKDGDTPLHLAILLLLPDVALKLIELMVQLAVPLDTPNRLHQTAQHLAVLTKQESIVKALLSAGASIYRRDHQLRTPMTVACENNDHSTLDLYTEHVDREMRDREATFNLLVPNINPLNLPKADGERCLHLAAKLNNPEMSRKIIEKGADPNLPDRKSGRTPLHVAADLGHKEMVQYLISLKEMDINQRTFNGETAIDIAHMRGREEVVQLLKPISFPFMKRKEKGEFSTG